MSAEQQEKYWDNQFKYAIHFNINYETKWGEVLYVLGSIPELGNWTEHRLKLEWTEGHIWRNTEPLLVSNPIFEYKYVVQGKEDSRFEDGENRVSYQNWPKADLVTLDKEVNKRVDKSKPQVIEVVDAWEENMGMEPKEQQGPIKGQSS